MTPDEIVRERARLEYEIRVDEIKLRIDNQVKKLDALFKNLTLVNGGAIVALFTLLGKNEAASLTLNTRLLWWAFVCFALGLVCTILATGMSFFSQYHLSIRAKRQAWNEQAGMFGLAPEYDAASPFRRSKRYMLAVWLSSCLAIISFIAGASFAMTAVLPS